LSRRSSSSTGRSWAGHDDDRAACDLGCLAYVSSVCVLCGAWSVVQCLVHAQPERSEDGCHTST
jgi:hypothetical protein